MINELYHLSGELQFIDQQARTFYALMQKRYGGGANDN